MSINNHTHPVLSLAAVPQTDVVHRGLKHELKKNLKSVDI